MRRFLALGALVVAAAFCGWSGWSYHQSARSGSVRFAEARDQVQRAGRQEIATLNTLDPRLSDAGLGRWLNASTGALRDELRRTSARNRQKVARAQVSAEGTVTDLAVTELDTRAGTAQVIATVQVDLGSRGTERKRFTAVLARTSSGWKLSALTAVPVGAH
jgi:Mce-associated membrane protein